MARNAKGLSEAITEIQALKKEFWSDVKIPGEINEMNPELDKANRVADFIELGELMCKDALNREETPTPREPESISNCSPFNIFGLPAISVPCGFSKGGMPIGLMIVGPRFSEGKVLALASAYEKATEWHTRRPGLSPDMAVPPVTRKS